VSALQRQHLAELAEQAADAIDESGAGLNETLSRTVHHELGFLLEALHRHEAHGRVLHRFADRRRVRRIVAARAAHAVGGDELRGDQAHGVAARRKQPRPGCAPLRASMATVHGGKPAMSSCSLARGATGRTSASLPPSCTPCTAITFLARSMPAYRIAMGFPFRVS
jgi:hypothetical protein